MPSLRRVRNTFYHQSDEDTVMLDATSSTVDDPVFSGPLAPSRSVNGSTSLGKRRRVQEGQPAKRASKRIAAMASSKMTPDFPPGEILTPVISPPRASIPDTAFPPSKRPNLSLDPIDNTSTNIPHESSPFSTSRCPEPASPAVTEIAYDIGHVEQRHEERLETLRAAGIKVRDFAYEPMPNSSKAPEVFDPVPSLIAADWHMRNPEKNRRLLNPKGLFRLIKMGWLTLDHVRQYFNPFEYVALAHYNDKPDERRYPFVVASKNESMPTPSRRVRLRRQAGLATNPGDLPDALFFGYNPTGFSDDEGEGGPPPRVPTTPVPVPAETTAASTSAVVEAEAEAVVVEKTKPKHRKVKGKTTVTKTKTRPRTKPKSLRRERSRPEV